MSEYVKTIGELNKNTDAPESPAQSTNSHVQPEGGDSLAGVQINMGDSERAGGQ